MATPCISPPKLHRNGISNLLHPRLDTPSKDSFSKSSTARPLQCDGLSQCRFAYATWCPVCKEQEKSKKIYQGSRRRSKSEGMEMDRSKDYYNKATNSETYHYQSGISFVKRRQLSRKLLSDERTDNCEYSVSAKKEQFDPYFNKTSECSYHSKFDGKVKTVSKRVCKPCENHFEPNCPIFDTWNRSHNEWDFPRSESEVMPLHERYYYEVEMLRNKLHKLRETPIDNKRVKHVNETDYSNNLVEVGTKRPRDVSPSIHTSSSAVRKLLPSATTSKGPLLPREKSVLSSESVTSYSSDSEYNDSGCEEEDIRDNNEVDLEEDVSTPGLKNSFSNSNSPSRLVDSISINDQGECVVIDSGKIHSALRPSLFSHVPPYIRFSTHDVKGAALPPSIQKLLKWKLSTITPVVVRRTVLNSNFKLVRKSNEWCGTWGKHMKSLCFKTLREYQKINHFPGTFQIGRKDRLWKNLFRLTTKFGRKEFGFIPKTYVLPQDNKLLRAAWEKNCGKETWIVKPPASARGTGIKVIHKWTQIPKKCPLVVQKYILNPYLINGSKFDLRLYVLVTSINPLRIYMYDNGLVRFASVKYSNEFTSLADRYMHLTNYSINKLSSQYTQNEDATACQGHKWSLQALWTYLREERKVDVKALWKTLVDLVIKTIISGESPISQLSSANLASRYCSYELFGIDVLLDHELRPWLLEVNISPSLHSSSPLDLAVKGPMVQDLMNIAGYQIPNKLSAQVQQGLAESLGLDSNLCFDRRLYTTALSHEERLKHINFQQMECRTDYLDPIVQDLTPDDVRHLVQYEDELTQIGSFQKIFPTTETYEYHHFFEAPRYYNMLFDAWEVKQSRDRSEGIALLQSLCQKQVHLDVTQIPPKRTKVSMSLSENELRELDLLEVESQEAAEDFRTALHEKINCFDGILFKTGKEKVTALKSLTVDQGVAIVTLF
ncbi:tubulin monoglutamylase TTLL4-like isoform X2 [Macrosteles quadrilineatus]|uniref:tubulin monoglutamylase TTLL4-like isoform X2 n=1 Tax=Macrosteles quadrilineatus TaxID=74068 RepID=UPI0023E13938|nr:tubulin monoglutamylase TTLL4-like isoform X2 [Macrosteles quadrilineatus]